MGPLVGGLLLFDGEDGTASSSLLALPYAVIGVVVLIVALIFSRTMLPEPAAESPADGEDMPTTDEPRSLWSYPTFVFGLVALFLYVAAQTGLNSFFINYATENADINAQTAAVLLGFGCMGLFMLGRMGGSWLMSMVRSERVLAACGVGAVLTMAVILFCPGSWGIAALLVCYLCESIMFPTIFALAIKGVGRHTKQASSYLIMSIVGGAVAPLLMGLIADTTGDMRPAFTVPMLCYAVITAYAVYLSRKRIAD